MGRFLRCGDESVSFGSHDSAVGLGASAPAVASDTYVVGTRPRVLAILIRGIGMAPFDLTLLRLSAALCSTPLRWVKSTPFYKSYSRGMSNHGP